MNNTDCSTIRFLPNIDMYGGDTLPWEMQLVREDGTLFSYDYVNAVTATMTWTPYTTSTGLSRNAVPVSPVLEKIGVCKLSLTDTTPVIVFEFTEDDTKHLRGKFIYQIEVKQEEEVRLCQGQVYVKQNINR